MKAPRIAFNKDAVLTFLLSHGEKVIAGMVGLAACGLAWGGLSALRSMRPSQEQQPEALVADADATARHIAEVKEVPPDELTAEKGLAKTVSRWLSPKMVPAPPHTLFNKPLFAELSRRTTPAIMAIEDLRAVSGVVVLAVKPKAAGDRPPDRPLKPDPGQAAKPAKPGRGGRQPGPAPAVPAPPDPSMIAPGSDPGAAQGKIVPYVLVTGLIPVAKQREEYGKRFATASFRDAVRDTPAWSNFQLEKTEVRAGTAEKWTPVDLKAVTRRYSVDWAGLQNEPLLPPFVLGPEQERRDPAVAPIPFCSPMPQLLEGAWGFNALHPWVTAFLQRDAEERRAKARADEEKAQSEQNVFGGPAGAPAPDGFGLPGAPPGGPASGMLPGADGTMPQSLDYRLFRFIDLAVVPGRSYRYRVKVICWNPNLNVPGRHLADPALAKQPTLESPTSAASAAVAVPDGIRMLVQPMKKQDLKRLKPGTAMAMILGRTNAGTFGLRTLLMEAGGLANVDPGVNKRGDTRSRGEAIVTDRVLLDMRGRLEDRAETRTGKQTSPPEPLEMIFLRPDGTFEVASSADSQPDIERYFPTLQPDDAAPPAGDRPPQPPGGDSPFGNPFAPKN